MSSKIQKKIKLTNLKKMAKQQLKNKPEERDSTLTGISNSLLKKSIEIKNSLVEETKLLKLNGDNSILSSFIIDDNSKTNIINHSQIYNSSIPNDNISLTRKLTSSIDIKNSSDNNSINISKNKKCNIQKGCNYQFNSMKQCRNLKNNSNDKILKCNTIFKSLRETLKKAIILRPEEFHFSSRKMIKNKSTNKSIPKTKVKSKFKSNVHIPNIPRIDLNLNNNKIENNENNQQTIIQNQVKNIENENKKNENYKIKNENIR